MLKKALLLFSLWLLTGCVERGFQVTVNEATRTITAVKSVDIREQKKADTAKEIEKMNKAVTQAQKKQMHHQVPHKLPTAPPKHTIKVQHKNSTNVQQEEEAQVRLATQKAALAKEKEQARQKEMEKRRAALEAKHAKEKEAQRLAAQQERIRLEKKAQEEKLAQEKKEQALKALKEEKERKALEEKLAKEKAAREAKEKEEKLALERKIAQEKALQLKKEQEEKAALARKLEEEKQRALQKQQAEEKRKQEEAKKAEALRKKAAEEKLRQEREAAIQKANAQKQKPLQTAEALNFKPSMQTYQKFGTSEIHGHVVYLSPTGQEIHLQNTKVYLVPQSTTTDYWYNNYYLKNRESASLAKKTVRYINATHLNLEKNFAFYGLAKGTYYVIIESSYPSSIAKNKKVYIAKKINVEKYKKIMTVFSKKL